MTLRLFYIAVVLAMMTILPFFPTAGFSIEETEPTVAVPKRRAREEVRGKIAEIDPLAKRLRITPGIFGSDKEIGVTERTEITIQGRRATFHELRAGDKVRVQYITSAQKEKTAELIEVV